MKRPNPLTMKQQLQLLRAENDELMETIRAIQSGQVDALIVDGDHGEQVFTLKGAEQPYRELVEAMNEGAATLSENGLILYCNLKFAQMVGLRLEKVIGSSADDLFVLSPDKMFRDHLQHPIAQTFTASVLAAKGKEKLRVQISLSAVPIGDVKGFCIVVTDLTERLGIESRLREVNETLEAHVIARTSDLTTALRDTEQAKQEAIRANETKSAFLANMSHEIRTPLGAILGFTDLLKERDLPYAEKQQFLETISRNGKALTRIIDDILDLAKVESGKLETENVEFSFLDLIDDVMDLFRERARSKNIFLRFHAPKKMPERIISDPTRLRQIMINILGNAVKFTDSGGISMDVEFAERKSGYAFRVSVQDSGVGLTAEQAGKLFRPFVQADNTTSRRFGGTGLGLVLSRRLARALGGDIEIDNAQNLQGSTFVITFAAGRALKKSPRDKIMQPVGVSATIFGSLSGVQILIADDSKDNQFLVTRALKTQGATVDIAEDGIEAFRKGLEGNYDLILMDIQMPKMDGYEATRSLREAGYKKPIVALTAHAMSEERARTLAAGCSGHLTKPLNRDELIHTIQQQLQANAQPK